MTVSVSVAQRRARLVERHRLAVAADSVVGAVDAMIALHGTDPTAVYLSAWARTGCPAEQLDEAIYAERSLVRMLGDATDDVRGARRAGAGGAGGVHG